MGFVRTRSSVCRAAIDVMLFQSVPRGYADNVTGEAQRGSDAVVNGVEDVFAKLA